MTPQLPQRGGISGSEWLGTLPAQWTSQPLKLLFQIVGGSTPKSDVESYWEGNIVWVTPTDLANEGIGRLASSQRTISEEGLASCGTTLVPPRSIVLSTRAPIGSLGMAQVSLCTNQGCKSLVPRESVESRFYAFLLSIMTEQLRVRGKGTTFLELSSDELGNLRVPVPPPPEQTAIAAFLDHETGKIDALVEEQKRLIELLKEKQQAVISHAVTKGLNPDAAMKDSGVEWLGEVPEHWEIMPIKRCFRAIDYGISNSLEPEGDVAVLRMGNIQNGRVLLDDLKYVDSVEGKLLLQSNDLLYNRTNSLDLIGKVGRFEPKDGQSVTFASYLVRLRTISGCDPVFLCFALNTEGILGAARSRAFVSIGQCNLNPTRYGEISIASPPHEEQIAIAAYLEQRIGSNERLLSECRMAIGLLQERRSALISAAVTGKIDVRGMDKVSDPATPITKAREMVSA